MSNEEEYDSDIYSQIETEDGVIIETLNNIAICWTQKENQNEQ